VNIYSKGAWGQALLVVLFLLPGLGAEEWTIIGPRAMGMGGAGVAVTRGGLSTYWNPAGLAPPHAPRLDTFWDAEIPASLQAAATNNFLKEVGDVVDLLNSLDFIDGGALTETDLQNVIRLVAKEIPELGEDDRGVTATGSVGLAAKIGYFGMSAMGLVYTGGIAKVDSENIALGTEGLTAVMGAGNDRTGQLTPEGQDFADQLAGDGLATQNQAEEIVYQAEQAGLDIEDPQIQQNIEAVLIATQENEGGSPERSITNNQSGADMKSLVLQEYTVSFAYPFFEFFSLGVSGKALYGRTSFQPYDVAGLSNIDDPQDLFDDIFDSEEETLTFGIDVGALVEPFDWLAVGVVGRNLNRPSFDYAGPGDYVLDPQVRAGVGVHPLPGLTLAADIDLYVNHSEALPGYDSQQLGGGIEYALLEVLPLRVGISKNLAEADEALLLHAGLGLRIWRFYLDVAAHAATDLTKVTWEDGGDSVEVPERFGFSLLLGANIPLD